MCHKLDMYQLYMKILDIKKKGDQKVEKWGKG